ncbi:MAG: transporter substrate-binding domain-containing protein [Rhodobacteraceae bacterium]|nr:MAG: transporter substrate-binding domain-containing protein [Paracoccaceae bacterium]
MRRKAVVRAVSAAVFLALASVGPGQAQETCGGVYTVRPGDSLTGIADRLYRNAGMWREIHSSNLPSIGPDRNNIRTGQRLQIACIDGLPTGLPGGKQVPKTAERTAPPRPESRPSSIAETGGTALVRILAGDGYPPFSDRMLPEDGMMSAIVDRAFAAAEMGRPHRILWVNDRAAHLDPMLASGMADVAFPWTKPACDGAGACADFLYSDPMFEMLEVLFGRKDAGLTFDSAADLGGRRLCRPDGLPLEALNGPEPGWLDKIEVTVLSPVTVQACFERLIRGEADFVVLNEFTGRKVLADMGLVGEVEVLDARPVSIESLHLVAHRANPHAAELIATFNQGLSKMRESGAFDATVDAHLASFWAGL